MVNSISNIQYSDEKINKAFDIVKRALEAAHRTSKVNLQTREIRIALETKDYNFCFDIAQKFLRKYKNMINSYTFLTGIVVINITPEEADTKNITYWKSVLKFTEMLIYANEAIDCGLKHIIEEKFKKIFLS